MDRQILHIALPAIVSNITVPLLGLVDLAIVGHLGATAYIGAISVGGMIFNVMYWIFAFLRMGSSGLTAQAFGRGDRKATAQMMMRSLVIAVSVAAVILLFQYPLRQLALLIMSPSEEVRELVKVYYNICVWGAPASLGLFALSGWFIGMQDSRSPMFVAILQNITNILASLFFVYGLKMKVEGVALGTLIAQWAGFLIALLIYFFRYAEQRRLMEWGGLMNHDDMVRFFSVNRDIFLRTCCLVAVFLFFTSAGAWQSDVVLATNTILMQFYLLFSYIMDGFAYAGEALGGKFYGAGDRENFQAVVKRLFRWGIGMAVAFSVVYVLGSGLITSLLTDDQSVVAASADYRLWTWVMPFAGFAAFVWDGIFIGVTASRQMLISSSIATASFFTVYYSLFPSMHNHALWLAFIVFLLARGISQTFLYRKL